MIASLLLLLLVLIKPSDIILQVFNLNGMKVPRFLFCIACTCSAGILFFLYPQKSSLFQQMSSSHTGIHFNNVVTENDSLNPLKNLNIYNGGG